MNRFWVRFSIVLVFLAGLSGCGQKGPLYLPDDGNESAPDEETAESANPTS